MCTTHPTKNMHRNVATGKYQKKYRIDRTPGSASAMHRMHKPQIMQNMHTVIIVETYLQIMDSNPVQHTGLKQCFLVQWQPQR